MIRKIIKIDENKCNGCGICITACHEGALELVDGKAKLISEVYCDGLGDCLPKCSTGAIVMEEREAQMYDKTEMKKHLEQKNLNHAQKHMGGCPGMRAKSIEKESERVHKDKAQNLQSELRQWPCQIKLVHPNAPYFNDAHLLIAADCTAYAYVNIHDEFMKNKITLIGCPKLDDGDYSEKLTEILKMNNIKTLTVLRMEVPCCSGIANAAKDALINSGKMIPWRIVTISTDGQILED